jgi:hypothetical protein
LCSGKSKVEVDPVDVVKACRGNRDSIPPVLYFQARWRRVVNFTPQIIYPWKKNPVPFE